MPIKKTYSLDEKTILLIDSLSKELNISKSTLIAKSIRQYKNKLNYTDKDYKGIIKHLHGRLHAFLLQELKILDKSDMTED